MRAGSKTTLCNMDEELFNLYAPTMRLLVYVQKGCVLECFLFIVAATRASKMATAASQISMVYS